MAVLVENLTSFTCAKTCLGSRLHVMSGGEGGKVIQVCADLGGRLFLHDDTRAVGRRGKGVAVCIKQVVAMSLEPMRQVVGVEMDVVHMQRWIPDRNGRVGRSAVSPVYLMMRSPGSELRYTWIVCHSIPSW